MTSDPSGRINIGDMRPGDVALLRDLAEVSAEKAVEKTFVRMGLDPGDPINAQRDFSFLRSLVVRLQDSEFSDDLNWVRRTRKHAEGAIGKLLGSAVAIAVLGALHAMWVGLQNTLGKQ